MHSVAHPDEQQPIHSGSRVALLINSLGGTPALELGVVANAAVRLARQQHQVSSRPAAPARARSDASSGCFPHV